MPATSENTLYLQQTTVEESYLLPSVFPETSRIKTRSEVLHSKKGATAVRNDAASELKYKNIPPDEKSRIYEEIKFYNSREIELENELKYQYVPQHGPQQFISPRMFMVSPLFRVASRAEPRSIECDLTLVDDGNGKITSYFGPELRQNDGLVFFSIISMLRDFPAGSNVQFLPAELCKALYGQYDGRSRSRLRDDIRRLQRGQIRTRATALI